MCGFVDAFSFSDVFFRRVFFSDCVFLFTRVFFLRRVFFVLDVFSFFQLFFLTCVVFQGQVFFCCMLFFSVACGSSVVFCFCFFCCVFSFF